MHFPDHQGAVFCTPNPTKKTRGPKVTERKTKPTDHAKTHRYLVWECVEVVVSLLCSFPAPSLARTANQGPARELSFTDWLRNGCNLKCVQCSRPVRRSPWSGSWSKLHPDRHLRAEDAHVQPPLRCWGELPRLVRQQPSLRPDLWSTAHLRFVQWLNRMK